MANTETMTVKIVSIEFDKELTNQSDETYIGCHVTYREEDELKEKKMHNNTFRFNKELEKQLKGLNPGDYAEVITEKKGSFVNWKSAEKVDAPTKTENKSASKDDVPSKTQVRSSYETPEERYRKNILIVRQSSITAALNLASLAVKSGSDYVPTEDDIIASAKIFEEYVNAPNEVGEQDVKLPD